MTEINTNGIPKKEETYLDLKNRIIREELKPGDWLVERDMGEYYGMSRTPLREILWRLEKDGLLVQEPGKGFQIRKLSLEEIFEVFQAREAVEGMAAFLSCYSGNSEFFLKVSEYRDRLLEIKAREDVEEATGIGSKLHHLLLEGAGNSILKEFHHKLENLYALIVNITKKSTTIEEQSRQAHIEIMSAVLDRDGERAEGAMRQHLRTTCKNLTEVFYPRLGL